MDVVHKYTASKKNTNCEICEQTEELCGKGFQAWVAGSSETPNALLAPYRFFNENLKLLSLKASRGAIIMLSTAGNVFSWGESKTTLGRPLQVSLDDRGRFAETRKAIQVPNLRGVCIVSIACGDYHVLALQTNMLIWSWGSNRFGQLGQGAYDDSDSNPTLDDEGPRIFQPACIESVHNIVRIFAKYNSSFAVSVNGETYSWGDNSRKHLGLNTARKVEHQPVELEESPWNKTSIIGIEGGERSYIVQTNAAMSNLTRTKMRKMQAENEDLRKKITRITERNLFLQEEQDDSRIKSMWLKDPNYIEIERLKREVEDDIEEDETQATERNKRIEVNKKKLNKMQLQLADYEEEEKAVWLRFEDFQEIMSQAEVTDKITKDEEQLHVKANEVSGLVRKTKESIEQINKDSVKLKKEMERFTKAIEMKRQKQQVFNDMIYVCKKHLTTMHMERSHNVLENEIKTLNKVYNAMQLTSVENLSKNMNSRSPIKILDVSRALLRAFKAFVVTRNRPASVQINITLNRMWKVIDYNLDMRMQILDYIQGLTGQTAKKLENFYKNSDITVTKESIHGEQVKKTVKSILDYAGIEETNELKDMYKSEKEIPRMPVIEKEPSLFEKSRRCC